MTQGVISGVQLPDAFDYLSPLLWGQGSEGRLQRGYAANAAESYVVISARATLLVPSRSLAVARRSLRAFRGSRSRANAGLATLGSAVLAHRVALRLLPTLSVCTDVPEDRIAAGLQRILGLATEPHLLIRVAPRRSSSAYAVIGIFDDAGRAVAYAKLDQPAAQVISGCVRESRALQDVDIAGLPIIAPKLLHLGNWRRATLMVTSLLPTHLRRVRLSAPDRVRLVKQISQAGGQMEQPAEGSAFALSVADYLAQAHSVDPPTAELLDRVWRSIDDTVSLPMGRAHGDLAPWNVGMYQGRIVVWDWEDSRAMMPIGIDLVHWHFQMGLAARDHVRAVRSAMAADKDLSLLGLEAGQRRLVLFGYVIEHLARRLTTGELPIMEARAAARDLQARYQSS